MSCATFGPNGNRVWLPLLGDDWTPGVMKIARPVLGDCETSQAFPPHVSVAGELDWVRALTRTMIMVERG